MTDRELLEKLRNPETRNFGFNLLIQEYQQKVYRLVRKMVIDHDDADDIVQEVFIKAWKSVDKFRGEAKLFTWIHKIAANECITFLKKKKRRFYLPLKDVEVELSALLDSSPLIDGEEIQLKLQKAILKLPAKQKLVFQLKYFEEMKYDQIAEITNNSIGALKASYHHAVKKIEKLLGDD